MQHTTLKPVHDILCPQKYKNHNNSSPFKNKIYKATNVPATDVVLVPAFTSWWKDNGYRNSLKDEWKNSKIIAISFLIRFTNAQHWFPTTSLFQRVVQQDTVSTEMALTYCDHDEKQLHYIDLIMKYEHVTTVIHVVIWWSYIMTLHLWSFKLVFPFPLSLSLSLSLSPPTLLKMETAGKRRMGREMRGTHPNKIVGNYGPGFLNH